MQLPLSIIKDLLEASLKEDFGIKGDITSNAVIGVTDEVEFTIICREEDANFYEKKKRIIQKKTLTLRNQINSGTK